jgi:hypothetical protein
MLVVSEDRHGRYLTMIGDLLMQQVESEINTDRLSKGK